jgi:hypothetical protein
MRTQPARERYGAVFTLLLVGFVVGATVGGELARLVLLVVFAVTLLLVLRAAGPATHRARRWARIVLGVGTAVTGGLAAALPGQATEVTLLLWLALVLLFAAVAMVNEVLRHPTVTMQTILGALSAYLLIGFFFAALFGAIARLEVPFFATGAAATGPTVQYFSFVTLTTTGYGDLTAAGNTGRALAVLEALFGQIFLVTLVARLVALFGQPRPARAGRAARDGDGDGDGDEGSG